MKKIYIIIISFILVTNGYTQTTDRVFPVTSKEVNESIPEAPGIDPGSGEIKEIIQKQDNLLALLPNPNAGNFTIGFMKQPDGARLFIYDLAGNYVIKNAPLDQVTQEVNLSNHPKGIYFIEILNGTRKSVSKVVVH